jgi:hypothetical protein
MSEERVERRLAAILAADVVGYSRLMGEDEESTLATLKTLRRELIDPKVKEHHGRIVKTTGDGALVEFASVVDAVRCAVEIQREMVDRNADVPPERRIAFRIGINLGDIIIDEGDIYGDGVNVAARLESPGGAGRDLRQPGRARSGARQARLRFRGSGRAAGQEHLPPGSILLRSVERSSPGEFGRCTGCGNAARQAVDRGAAIRKHQRRPGAGVFRRRHGRGDHHRAQPHPLALRRRP